MYNLLASISIDKQRHKTDKVKHSRVLIWPFWGIGISTTSLYEHQVMENEQALAYLSLHGAESESGWSWVSKMWYTWNRHLAAETSSAHNWKPQWQPLCTLYALVSGQVCNFATAREVHPVWGGTLGLHPPYTAYTSQPCLPPRV